MSGNNKIKNNLEYEDYYTPSMTIYAIISILAIILMLSIIVIFGMLIGSFIVSVGLTL